MKKFLAIAAAAAVIGGDVVADEYPSKSIEVVTHAGAGGGTDVTARMMMLRARRELGQQIGHHRLRPLAQLVQERPTLVGGEQHLSGTGRTVELAGRVTGVSCTARTTGRPSSGAPAGANSSSCSYSSSGPSPR